MTQGRIILDFGGEIQAEYLRHLNPHGQPGVGDRFLQVVLNSAPTRVERVELGKTEASLTIFRTIQTSRPSIEAIENS